MVLDTHPPVIEVSGVSDGAVTRGPVTLTWTVTDTHLASSSATLNGQPVESGASVSLDGEYDLVVTATDRGGLSATRRVHFSILTAAPVITISGVTEGQFSKSAVTPTFSAASPHLDQVTATLNDVAFTSGTEVGAEREHTLTVHARDLAGNEATSVVHFTLDFTAPQIQLLGASEGAFLKNHPVTITYGATDLYLATLEAASGSEPFASGTVVTAERDHAITVTATDRAGNVATASLHFTLDYTSPVISVSGVVSGQVGNESVRPVFSATDLHLLEPTALLDGVAFTSGTLVSIEDSHLLQVSASDRAGNVATVDLVFTIDRTPPVISVSGIEEGAQRNGPVTIAYAADEPHPGTLSAKLDDADFASGSTVSAPGPHTLIVSARDEAGNEASQTVHFLIDLTLPEIQVGGVADGDFKNAPVRPTFGATDEHLREVTATLDGPAFQSGDEVSAPGEHALVITATDVAGNVATRTVTFTLDFTAPEVAITGATEGEYRKNAAQISYQASDEHLGEVSATADSVSFTGQVAVTADGPHAIVVVAFDRAGNRTERTLGFTIDSIAPEVAVSGVTAGHLGNQALAPTFSATDANLASVTAKLDTVDFESGTTVSTDGDHQLVVTAVDKAGNEGHLTVPFTLDFHKPEITVTGVVDGERRNTAADVQFSATDAHLGPVTATLGGVAFTGGVVSEPGTYQLVVTAKDLAGNEDSKQVGFTIDQQPPAISVIAPSAGFATSASETELVVAVTDDGPVGTVTVGGSALALGPDGKYRGSLALTEGVNLFEVSALDSAGNGATASVEVIRDSAPPALSVATPQEGAFIGGTTAEVTGTVSDATALTLTVGGQSATIAGDGSFTAQVALQPGANALEIVATDLAGNQTPITRNVRANANPPALTVTEPTAGFSFPDAFLTVRGVATVNDPDDVAQVTVDGVAVAVNAQGEFATTIEVAVGPRTITVHAADRYGLESEHSVQVTRLGETADGGTPADGGTGTDGGTPGGDDGGTAGSDDAGTTPAPIAAPVLRVEAPVDGQIFGTARVAVTGTIEEGELPFSVKVNDASAVVSTRQFSASLALAEGTHVLHLAVTDAKGRQSSVDRTIYVDRTEPFLAITRPGTNPAQVNESPYRLEGQVGDANLADVTVNGYPVAVIAGQFSTLVSVHAGDNDVVVEARDLAGNLRHLVQRLSVSSVPPDVVILDPLDGTESKDPIVTVQVRVTATSELQEVRIGTGLATRVTEGTYEAQVPLALGDNEITASATDVAGLTGLARVQVRYRDSALEPLAVTGVDPVPGQLGVETDALVSVAFNKPVKPETLAGHFTVSRAGEPLAGGFSVAPGGQTVSFIAKGALPEGERLLVRVTDDVEPVAGPGLASDYSSDFTVRSALTIVRGTVMDDRFQPLGGVLVQASKQGQSVRTGPDGNWAMIGLNEGDTELRYEGGVASDGRSLPTIRRRLFVTRGTETRDRPLTLIPTNTAATQYFDGLAGGEVTFGGALGALRLDVPAEGTIFADGRTSGYLTATEIPPYARPVPIEDRASVSALWQLAPEGVRFLKPIELTVPNTAGLAAGRMAVILSFDDRRLVLRRVGFAHVTSDGTAIRSDEPIAVGSLEFFGYMPLTGEQQAKIELALQEGTVTPPSPEDGGMGAMLFPPTDRRTPWERIADMIVPTAHAQYGGMSFLIAAMDSFPGGIAYVKGSVRAPHEQETRITVKQPVLAATQSMTTVALPYVMPVEFIAEFESNQPRPPNASPETVTGKISAIGPTGQALAPPKDESWVVQGLGKAEMFSAIEVPVGTSTISLQGATRYDTRTVRVSAILEPVPDADGGTAQATQGDPHPAQGVRQLGLRRPAARCGAVLGRAREHHQRVGHDGQHRGRRKVRRARADSRRRHDGHLLRGHPGRPALRRPPRRGEEHPLPDGDVFVLGLLGSVLAVPELGRAG